MIASYPDPQDLPTGAQLDDLPDKPILEMNRGIPEVYYKDSELAIGSRRHVSIFANASPAYHNASSSFT